MTSFAITDLHGCVRTFRALLEKIRFSKQDELYLLGDYINRGPDSRGVIDHILELRESGHTVHCLRGNHDQMLLDGIDRPYAFKYHETWYGRDTLASFGCQHPQDLPQRYLDFFRGLPFHLEAPPYLLVHAGLNFHIDDPLADTNALIWIRRWEQHLDRDWLDGRIVLYGHTPVGKRAIEQQLETLDERPCLGIDAGCVFNDGDYVMRDLGYLCAFDMTNRRLYFLANCEG